MTLEDEAQRIGRYFLGEPPLEREVGLYVQAHAALDFPLSPWEEALLKLALASPLAGGIIDGGLALRRPASAVRKKYFVMLAILETSPERCEMFFQPAFGPAGAAAIPLRLAWGGAKGAIGWVFVFFHEAFWKIRNT